MADLQLLRDQSSCSCGMTIHLCDNQDYDKTVFDYFFLLILKKHPVKFLKSHPGLACML